MPRPCLYASLRIAAVLLCAIGAFNVRAEDTPVTFRSDVSLVRVDAQVLDRDNRAVSGLRAEDFILLEEGRPQKIRNFASDNMPLDVLLLLDVSASMRPHVQRIASASHEALRVLGKDDRIAIMMFDRATRVQMPFTAGREHAEQQLQALLDHERFRGGTDITRGLYDAADYVSSHGRKDARRAIVIVTDDQTEFNRDVEGVSRALTRADAVLSALLAPDVTPSMSRRGGMGRNGGGGGGGGGGWPGSGPSIGGPLGGIILGRSGGGGRGNGSGGNGGPHTTAAGSGEIAQRSGGDSLSVDDASALESTLTSLRQRYSLYFNLPDGVRPGEERNIEVKLASAAVIRHDDALLRYRRVYLAPGGSKSDQMRDEPAIVTRRQSSSDATTATDADAADSSQPRRHRPVTNGGEGSTQGPILDPDARP